ncbi:TPA: hypothetical protein SIA35_004275 [Aeromonas sobria]|nr:hypothetical protein [Aeromonas sobria]
MGSISSLKKKLLSVIHDSDFMLDERSVLSYLRFIEKYTKKVPFKSSDSKDSNSKNWADYLFMDGNTPTTLAEMYNNPSTANGYTLPHQAFMLAMLKMLETPRELINYFPDAHRDLYYRELLALQEKTAVPMNLAVSVELDRYTSELMIPAGTLLDAGQDSQGKPINFCLDKDLLANRSKWQDLRWCYPATKGNTAGMSAIVFDKINTWPSIGLRLFESVSHETAILTGRILVSAAFMNDALDVNTVTIRFSEKPMIEGLSVHITAGGEWLKLDLAAISDRVYSFTLSKEMGISAGNGLSYLTDDKPVIRLSRVDNIVVPDIVSISMNGTHLEKDEYQIKCITPFGYSDAYHPVENMEVYLGISELLPGQTLSIFWNINSPQPLNIRWQYLALDGRWHDLGANLLDETQGLLRSGLWSVLLPKDASNDASTMPTGCYWFRAEIEPVIEVDETYVAHYPWLTGIVTNGVTATTKNIEELHDDIMISPLSAGSIQRLVTEIAGVSKIHQPWASWGGHKKESRTDFFNRTAQRLAHRNRALTWSDMVMILKTMFPDVFDVMTPSREVLSSVPALTEQKLVVLPLMTAKDNEDALRPLFNAAKLNAMSDALQSHASLWQHIKVQNPRYRNVTLRYQVIFREGVNTSWAERKLREELVLHFMPWSLGAVVGASLANRIDYYDVVATLQQQPYVDHVMSLSLDGHTKSVQGDDDEVLILHWLD